MMRSTYLVFFTFIAILPFAACNSRLASSLSDTASSSTTSAPPSGTPSPSGAASINFTQTPMATSTLTTDVIGFAGSTSSISQFKCSLDGAVFATCVSPLGLVINIGSHGFQVEGLDQSGVILATGNYNWTVVASLTPPTTSVTGWIPCAMGGDVCVFPSSASNKVIYGQSPDAGGVNTTKTFTNVGSVTCQDSSFGGNPNPLSWEINMCWYWGTYTPSQPASTITGPAITLPLNSPAFPGYNSNRVQTASSDPSQQPAPAGDGIGAFRDVCGFSHFAFNDPILFPGKPGASHLHMFFGNTLTDANSTSNSLQTTGGSTCGGGTLNRSGYWVPAMIDNLTHTPVRATINNVYYKVGYNGLAAKDIHVVPKGLVMIAGSSMNTTAGVNPVRYSCVGTDISPWYNSIPNCPVNSDLVMEVAFPQCWDGVNLDSTDHKSHMSNTVNGACPADHPVGIPEISYNIHYPITKANASANYQLASDNYAVSNGNAGYSGHGDYMYGWDDTTMQTFVTNCTAKPADCHDYLLGNGQTLY